ncbi:inter-alpha-trypsin inhibitor domain protein [gamma proteobacterium HTCC5015]|nr:inter-alpha-trypsin inhibitor domain protein [gamma proteobacterium HTCC5015]
MARRVGLIWVLSALLTGALASSPQPLAVKSLNDWLNQVGTGELLLKPTESSAGNSAINGWDSAVHLGAEVDVKVSGPVAAVTLKQSYRNDSPHYVEAIYAYPIAESAAVHYMEVIVGSRRIVGEIREKAQAKAIYQDAKKQGKRAALVEQQRPNLFTSKVANIAPGETIHVELRYTEALAIDGREFSLRLPTTMTSRFHPQESSIKPVEQGPIVPSSAVGQSSHLADITVDIDGGWPIQNIESPSHPFVERSLGRGYRVHMGSSFSDKVAMDQDVVLRWQLDPVASASGAVFSEEYKGEHYALVMLRTPDEMTSGPRMPREVVFVIDTSGSMAGQRMYHAKQALSQAVERLSPDDRFNVVEFNNQHSRLFSSMRSASAINVKQALNWVGRLQGGGGTMMLPAVEDALSVRSDPAYLRQVILITDASVGNEAEILRVVERQRKGARLFTVGIGVSPNSYLLRKAAQVGQGDYVYIASGQEVKARMQRLFAKLENPVLKQLNIDLPEGAEAEVWPNPLPDLYHGRPLYLAMKLDKPIDHLVLKAQTDRLWQQRIALPEPTEATGIHTLWAREKIAAQLDGLRQGKTQEEVRQAVLAVALEHAVMSPYTSFVAVEETPVRPAGEDLKKASVPNRRPVDQAYPKTALGLTQQWYLASLLMLVGLALLVRVRLRA